MAEALAVYTTVHPGILPYLGEWYTSLLAQTDRDFELWVGLDELGPADVRRAVGGHVEATWVQLGPGATPAQIREAAIARVVGRYGGVIFVDGDDRLAPTRVAAARAWLQTYDLAGCALRIIDQAGAPLGLVFGPEPGTAPLADIARTNVFGLSNTAYRSELLRRCLPIPPATRLVDWLLATRAWALGARIGFDHRPLMDYRQYADNIAPVLPPFTAEGLRHATGRVRAYYRELLESPWDLGPRRGALEAAAARAEEFAAFVGRGPDTLERYVRALNGLRPQYVWWWSVAHPALEELWRS